MSLQDLYGHVGAKDIEKTDFIWEYNELVAAPVKLSDIELAIGSMWFRGMPIIPDKDDGVDSPPKHPAFYLSMFRIHNQSYKYAVRYTDLLESPKMTLFFRGHISPFDMQMLRCILHVSSSHMLALMANPKNPSKYFRVLWIDADTVDPGAVMLVHDVTQPPLTGFHEVKPTVDPKGLYYNLEDPMISEYLKKGEHMLEAIRPEKLFQQAYRSFKQRRFWVRWHTDYPRGNFRVDLVVTQPLFCPYRAVSINTSTSIHLLEASPPTLDGVHEPYKNIRAVPIQTLFTLPGLGAVFSDKEEATQFLRDAVKARHIPC